jgi:hypothetical protein
MRTSKPKINKPKVPAKISPSVLPKAPSKSGERTRVYEHNCHEERYARERANHGLDERRRLTEIECASQRAHEKTLRDRACKEREDRRRDDEHRSFEHRSESEVGQAAARKERPVYGE